VAKGAADNVFNCVFVEKLHANDSDQAKQAIFCSSWPEIFTGATWNDEEVYLTEDGDEEELTSEQLVDKFLMLLSLGGDGDPIRGVTYGFGPFISFKNLAKRNLDKFFAVSVEC